MKRCLVLALIVCMIVSLTGCATFKTCYQPATAGGEAMKTDEDRKYIIVTTSGEEHLTHGSLMKWDETGLKFKDTKDGKVYSFTNDQITEIRCKKLSKGATIGWVVGTLAGLAALVFSIGMVKLGEASKNS